MCEVNQLPRCNNCNKLLRPNIKLQNDTEFLESRFNSQLNNYNNFLENLNDIAIIELGVSLKLPLIRNIGEKLLNSKKCSMIRINPIDVSLVNMKKVNVVDKNNTNLISDNKKNTYIGIESSITKAMNHIKNILL